MDFTQEMLAMFQEGKSIDDIAKMITKSLNDANAQYQEEQRKIDAAKAERVSLVRDIIASLVELMALYGIDDATLDEMENTDAEEVVDILDEEIPKLQDLFATLEDLGLKMAPKEEKPKKNNSDKSIEDFLNKFVR